MTNNLKLITTEKFGDLNCNFYRNMNDDILLTREQIGTALEYSAPQKAIQKIHLKHKDRFENLYFRIIDTRYPQSGGAGIKVETIYYTQRGIMEICRWSRQKRANEFMDWVWDIVEKYRNGELSYEYINIQPLLDSLHKFSENTNSILLLMDKRITNLESSQQSIQKQLPKKNFSSWTSKMFPKYQLLMDYFNINRKELYHNLYIELQNTYPDIDLSQEQDDYCFENGLDSCFTLDVIEHNRNLRMLFTTMVDNLLNKYNLAVPTKQLTRQTTIFD